MTDSPENTTESILTPEPKRTKLILWSAVGVIFLGYLLGVYWSIEPEQRKVINAPEQVRGVELVSSLIFVVNTLLEKPGGLLANDVLPPTVFLDNMPAFEYGAIVQSRDLTRSLRKEFSRSQSQSLEQEDLKLAEPKIYIAHRSWALPSAEGEYRDSIEAMTRYLDKLSDISQIDTQFYARADNLREWLGEVSNRLGSYSQRLSASVGQDRVNTDLAGEIAASQSTDTGSSVLVKTSWLEIDDVFYEARGATWALIQFLSAVEVDFADVLAKKNATASLQQIIRELEITQETVWSPMILNGGGFGFVANHSLVMASYISRANAAIIDLRELLSQG